MDNKINDLIFSEEVLSFIKIAGKYCSLLEDFQQYTLQDFIKHLLIYLPELYYRIMSIPPLEQPFSEYNEKFVTEDEYNKVYNNLINKFGQYDMFNGLYIEENFYDAEKGEFSISEYLTDIYQDIKNFIMLFQLGNENIMHDAIWECYENFELYWGKRIAELLRPLHDLYFSGQDLDENYKPLQKKVINTDNWHLSKRQQDFQNGLLD